MRRYAVRVFCERTLFSSCRDPAQEAIFLTATFPSALSFPFLKLTEQTLLRAEFRTICLLASVRERGTIEVVLGGTAGCEMFVAVACIFSTTARIAPAP